MKIRVTLLREGGLAEDVVIAADAKATVGDVAAMLVRADPRRSLGVDPESATLEILSAVHTGVTQVLDPTTSFSVADPANGSAVRVVAAGHQARPNAGSLTVTSGFSPGRTVPLARGSYTIGRDAACDIVVSDPLVSKRHARLEVTADRVELVDLNSANGILVGGMPVTRLEARDGRLEALLGDTRIDIVVDAPAGPSAGASVRQKSFVRSPRVEPRYPGEKIESTELPAPAKKSPFPWLALAAPLIMGGVMFAMTQQLMSLLFVALSPFLMIGTWLSALMTGRREAAEELRRFRGQFERLSSRLEERQRAETEARRGEVPQLADVLAHAVSAGPLIWTRRSEHWSYLHVDLGRGDAPSRDEVGEASGRDNALAEHVEQVDRLVAEHATVADVPILESLHTAGALGVAGDRARTAGYARALLAQLAGLHAPADLVVTAIMDAAWSRELSDLRWLPHTWEAEQVVGAQGLADEPAGAARLVAQLEELVASRAGGNAAGAARLGALADEAAASRTGAKVGESRDASPADAPSPAIVVVIAGAPPVDMGRLIQLTEDAATRGVYPIWLRDDVASLPSACRTFVRLAADGTAAAEFVRLGTAIEPLRTDTLAIEQFGPFCRALARLTDAGRVETDSSEVPRSVSLVQMLGQDMALSADAVVDRWIQNESIPSRLTPGGRRSASKLRALVGEGAEGAMHLDLRSQGPHALVGGTTGSGKSEFLQAWVLGMAAEYSPQRVTFLFVDYKGGSAFADCTKLPHSVGIVTDLNPHLVRRVLVSLRAELHHRERLLNRRKAKDILELEKRGDPHAPPALVLVIDEFAALATEVPEFVDGVVDIAQRGRSLGIHLIMATQRPAGVIKDNLRANTNLRVALRMADEHDSDDVIGAKDAALFDPGVPGRGIAKTGPGRTALFQSAYAGGWSLTAGEAAAVVEIATLAVGGLTPWEVPQVESAAETDSVDMGPNDQKRLVARMSEAAVAAGIDPPRRPWLDELASTFDQTKLPQRTDAQLVLGVIDVPTAQDQVPFFFSPDDEGHLAIFGTSGSGKSVALRTLAVSAAITPRGGPVHVYGIDFGAGGLKMLEPLPHVGSVIAGDDGERIGRLFQTLKDELDRRGDAFSAVSASSLAEYRELAGRPDEPRILVLIDGFQTMRTEYDTAGSRAETFRILQQVLSDGRALGIHVALTADRAQSVPNALNAMIQRRVVLRMADADAYSAVDAPRDILSADSPPGRAIVGKLEAQIAVIGGTRSTKEQSLAIERMAASMTRRGRPPAPPVRALPVFYGTAELPDAVDGGLVAVGVSDVDLGPIGIEPSGTFIVAGPPASGRSNALAALALQWQRARTGAPCFYLGASRSPAAAAVAWAGAAFDASRGGMMLGEVVAAMDAGQTPLLVIEGLNEYASTTLEFALGDVVKRAAKGEALLIAEGDTSQWISNFGLLGEIKSARRGIILQPETTDGDLVLKTTFPRIARGEFPVGRGILVQRGKAARVQLPFVLPTHGVAQ